MVVIVINQFSDGLKDYQSAFKNYDGEILLITTKKNKDAYSNIFENRVVFDDFYKKNDLYHFILEYSKSNQIDSIIATYEFDLEKVGRIRDVLKIGGQTEQSALEFRNKFFMKQKLVGKIRMPKFKSIESYDDLKSAISYIGFPMVVKPLDSAGSVGVKIYRTIEEIIEEEIEYPVLIEEYIPGDTMYHVDGLYHNGKFLFCKSSEYINGCLAFKKGDFVGSILLKDSDNVSINLKKEALKVLQYLDTPKHPIPFHAEFFYYNDEIIFCEIASRIGGGKINEMIRESTGVDLFVESIKASINTNYEFIQKPNIDDKIYGFLLIPAKKGKLMSIGECDLKGIKQFYKKDSKIGRIFQGGDSSASEIVSAVICSENRKGVEKLMSQFSLWSEENINWELDSK